MFLNKTGFEHIEYNINNQDFGFVKDNGFKCVVDGCSEGLHSEVGAKLFCKLFETEELSVEECFEKIFSVLDKSPKTIRDYLCFTMLYVVDIGDTFVVCYCGDGYIIKQKIDETIEFEKIDDGEFPKYYAYNYLGEKHLTHYKDGVKMVIKSYPKTQYKNIGVASDGLRYVFDKEYEDEFVGYIKNEKISAIKRLINRQHKHFKDDITIAF